MEGLRDLDREFDARRNNVERGRLAIAAGESTIHYALPLTVQKFAESHPGISLALNNVTGLDGLQQLRAPFLDFAVGPLLDTPPDIEFERQLLSIRSLSLRHYLAKLRV